MPDYDPEAEWTEWWPTGREWWIDNSASVKDLAREAYRAGWQQHSHQLARLGFSPQGRHEPGALPPTPERERKSAMMRLAYSAGETTRFPTPPTPTFTPHELPDYVPERPATGRTGPPPVTRLSDYTFEGAQDAQMRLEEARDDDYRARREHQRYVSTELMPAVPDGITTMGDVGTPDTPFLHTGTVYDGPPVTSDPFDVVYSPGYGRTGFLRAPYGAPGPVPTPLSIQEADDATHPGQEER